MPLGEAAVDRGPPAVPAAVPTGNTFDKYGSTNPVVKRLMAGFERDMFELLDRARPASILDVGCGEGVLTEQWARAHAGPRGRHRPRGPEAARGVGAPRRGPTSSSTPATGTASLRGRRVRGGHRDGGARARAGPGRGAGRDGARGVALDSRERSARAAVARAQHGARGLPARPRQHARPPEPLVQARASRACCAATARSSSCARRFRGRWRSSASGRDAGPAAGSDGGRASPTGAARRCCPR